MLGLHPPYLRAGLEFCSIDDAISLPEHFLGWAESFKEWYPKDARFWESSVPFISLGDGDHIGLYVKDNTEDPPICFLCHDGCGGSGLIACNFDSFLLAWEQVGYLEIDGFFAFINHTTGFLEPDAFPARWLTRRCLWKGELRGDLVKPILKMTKTSWNECGEADTLLQWLESKGDPELQKEKSARLT